MTSARSRLHFSSSHVAASLSAVPAQRDAVLAADLAARAEGLDDLGLDALDRLLERDVEGRLDLDRDRALALAAVDLLRARGERDVGDRAQGDQIAARRRDGQVLEVLETRGVALLADDREVDLVAAREVVAGVGAVDERVDGVAEVEGRHAEVGGALPARHDVDLRAREVEAGHGTDLPAGEHGAALPHDAPADRHEASQVGSANLDVDRAARDEAPLEEARLLREREGAGDALDRRGEHARRGARPRADRWRARP